MPAPETEPETELLLKLARIALDRLERQGFEKDVREILILIDRIKRGTEDARNTMLSNAYVKGMEGAARDCSS